MKAMSNRSAAVLQRLDYFAGLLSLSDEIDDSIRPLLKLSREHIARRSLIIRKSAPWSGTGCSLGGGNNSDPHPQSTR